MAQLPANIQEHTENKKKYLQTSSILNKKELLQLNNYLQKNKGVPLRLYWMDDGTDLSFLKELTHLTSLSIDFTPASLKPIGALTKLENLSFTSDAKIELADLQPLISLKALDINLNKAPGTYSFESMHTLKNLKKLSYVGKFPDEENLAMFTQLEELSPDLRSGNYSCLIPLKKLNSLTIYSQKYKGFEGLDKLKTLKELFIGIISQLPENKLDFLNQLPSLKKLRLDYLPTLQSMKFFTGKATVEELELVTLNGLTSLNGLELLKNLRKLVMAGTYKNHATMDFSALANCKKLQVADICMAALKAKKRKALEEMLPSSVKLK
jgi:hypothetical protein